MCLILGRQNLYRKCPQSAQDTAHVSEAYALGRGGCEGVVGWGDTQQLWASQALYHLEKGGICRPAAHDPTGPT